MGIQAFEQTQFENISITITSREKPYSSIQPGTPVTVKGLTVGFMAQARGTVNVFFSAEAIRPISRMQPSQPVRVAAGQ